MITVESIQALAALADVDARLRTQEEEASKVRGEVDQLSGNVKQLEARVEKERASVAVLERTRSDYLAEIRNMNNQIEHSRDKMGRARTEREVNAATRELEELRKLIRDREDELGRVVAEMDGVKQTLTRDEGELETARGELNEKGGEITGRLATLEAELAVAREAREQAAKKVPPAVFRKYDTIRQKRGSGLAQTIDGTCLACHMSLPPQLFHRLRREPILEQCPSCYRLIYCAAAHPTGAS